MSLKGKRILYYIIPSAGGLCVTYLYNIIDGIFVGQGVGHLALAAVNITVPFITALVAVSSLFAMGGSTFIAIRLGRGDKKGATENPEIRKLFCTNQKDLQMRSTRVCFTIKYTGYCTLL